MARRIRRAQRGKAKPSEPGPDADPGGSRRLLHELEWDGRPAWLSGCLNKALAASGSIWPLSLCLDSHSSILGCTATSQHSQGLMTTATLKPTSPFSTKSNKTKHTQTKKPGYNRFLLNVGGLLTLKNSFPHNILD